MTGLSALTGFAISSCSFDPARAPTQSVQPPSQADRSLRAPNFAAPQALSKRKRRKVRFMDKEHIKGAADKAKGAVKDAAG